MKKDVESWGSDHGPAKGDYEFKEGDDSEYIWVTRTTPVHHYVDDVIFEAYTVPQWPMVGKS
jgi:hypothetical protein